MIIFNYLLVIVINVLINLIFIYKKRIKFLENGNDLLWEKLFKLTHYLNVNLSDKDRKKFHNFLDENFKG